MSSVVISYLISLLFCMVGWGLMEYRETVQNKLAKFIIAIIMFTSIQIAGMITSNRVNNVSTTTSNRAYKEAEETTIESEDHHERRDILESE